MLVVSTKTPKLHELLINSRNHTPTHYPDNDHTVEPLGSALLTQVITVAVDVRKLAYPENRDATGLR